MRSPPGQESGAGAVVCVTEPFGCGLGVGIGAGSGALTSSVFREQRTGPCSPDGLQLWAVSCGFAQDGGGAAGGFSGG